MSSGDPAISVVVPTRDRRERLERLLASLAAQTVAAAELEVVVVDDGSRDGTPELLERAGARLGVELRVVPGPGGRGPAAARNRGWREARGELVAFIDDDCEAAPDWLERLGAAAAGDGGAIVQGRTVPNPAERDRLGPFARTKWIDPPTPFFQTCNIAYPRELLERLDGFDERFGGPAGEDADLGWRALELGAGRRSEPAAIVHHAVEPVGLHGFLREARRGSESALAYRRHPGLRAEAAYLRYFWARSHFRALLALAGLLLARRHRSAALLALPYARGLAGRARSAGAPWLVPLLVAYDLLEIGKAARGSARARVLML